MNLLQLQDKLSTVMEKLSDDTLNDRQRNKVMENAEFSAKVAKQMINNADIILRADKMCDRTDRINKVVGE